MRGIKSNTFVDDFHPLTPNPLPAGEGEKTMPVQEGQGLWRCTRNFKYVWIDLSTHKLTLDSLGTLARWSY